MRSKSIPLHLAAENVIDLRVAVIEILCVVSFICLAQIPLDFLNAIGTLIQVRFKLNLNWILCREMYSGNPHLLDFDAKVVNIYWNIWSAKCSHGIHHQMQIVTQHAIESQAIRISRAKYVSTQNSIKIWFHSNWHFWPLNFSLIKKKLIEL